MVYFEKYESEISKCLYCKKSFKLFEFFYFEHDLIC